VFKKTLSVFSRVPRGHFTKCKKHVGRYQMGTHWVSQELIKRKNPDGKFDTAESLQTSALQKFETPLAPALGSLSSIKP
jgi:hypothetical protein